MAEKRKIPVTRQDGTPARNMNEIEFWRGRVLANVWYEDVLLVIDPETGVVEKEYGTYWHTNALILTFANIHFSC
jgi:glutamine cyclotransferase